MRILIIDQNSEFRGALCDALMSGHTVMATDSWPDTRAYLEYGSLDAVLFNLDVWGAASREFVERYLMLDPGAQLIAYGQDDAFDLANLHPAVEFLPLPFTAATLFDTLGSPRSRAFSSRRALPALI